MPNSPAPEALFARLYFDRHIMARLAIDLRGSGYDVLTTEEAGLDTASDEEQLANEALLQVLLSGHSAKA
jgi:predicted nuclease of predicted toxin-antitoxin system